MPTNVDNLLLISCEQLTGLAFVNKVYAYLGLVSFLLLFDDQFAKVLRQQLQFGDVVVLIINQQLLPFLSAKNLLKPYLLKRWKIVKIHSLFLNFSQWVREKWRTRRCALVKDTLERKDIRKNINQYGFSFVRYSSICINVTALVGLFANILIWWDCKLNHN